jgi:hypothetical protein
MEKYELTPEEIDKEYFKWQTRGQISKEFLKINWKQWLADGATAKVLRLQAEEKAKQTPEKLREEMADWLQAYYPKYDTTDSGWAIEPLTARSNYLKSANQILSLVLPMIEQAKKEERERIFRDLEYMEIIKGHIAHRKGEIKVVACSRCTYEEYRHQALQDKEAK